MPNTEDFMTLLLCLSGSHFPLSANTVSNLLLFFKVNAVQNVLDVEKSVHPS